MVYVLNSESTYSELIELTQFSCSETENSRVSHLRVKVETHCMIFGCPSLLSDDSSAPSRMAATPPRPRSTAASLPSHLLFYCSSTTASGSHWRSPLLPAARSPQHRDPPQQRGLSDSVSLLPPGFRHQCNEVDRYGKKEAGTGEHLTHFNNKINKHK